MFSMSQIKATSPLSTINGEEDPIQTELSGAVQENEFEPLCNSFELASATTNGPETKPEASLGEFEDYFSEHATTQSAGKVTQKEPYQASEEVDWGHLSKSKLVRSITMDSVENEPLIGNEVVDDKDFSPLKGHVTMAKNILKPRFESARLATVPVYHEETAPIEDVRLDDTEGNSEEYNEQKTRLSSDDANGSPLISPTNSTSNVSNIDVYCVKDLIHLRSPLNQVFDMFTEPDAVNVDNCQWDEMANTDRVGNNLISRIIESISLFQRNPNLFSAVSNETNQCSDSDYYTCNPDRINRYEFPTVHGATKDVKIKGTLVSDVEEQSGTNGTLNLWKTVVENSKQRVNAMKNVASEEMSKFLQDAREASFEDIPSSNDSGTESETLAGLAKEKFACGAVLDENEGVIEKYKITTNGASGQSVGIVTSPTINVKFSDSSLISPTDSAFHVSSADIRYVQDLINFNSPLNVSRDEMTNTDRVENDLFSAIIEGISVCQRDPNLYSAVLKEFNETNESEESDCYNGCDPDGVNKPSSPSVDDCTKNARIKANLISDVKEASAAFDINEMELWKTILQDAPETPLRDIPSVDNFGTKMGTTSAKEDLNRVVVNEIVGVNPKKELVKSAALFANAKPVALAQSISSRPALMSVTPPRKINANLPKTSQIKRSKFVFPRNK